MKFAGYCLGASRVGLVVLEKEVTGQLRVVEARTLLILCNVYRMAHQLINTLILRG